MDGAVCMSAGVRQARREEQVYSARLVHTHTHTHTHLAFHLYDSNLTATRQLELRRVFCRPPKQLNARSIRTGSVCATTLNVYI